MKRFFSIFLIICFLISVPIQALASGQYVYIHDFANLLTESQKNRLENAAQDVYDTYKLDVVVLTVPTIGNTNAVSYADDYYNNHFSANGVLFLLAMQEREWYISTTGKAIQLLSDYELETIGDKVVPYLSDGDYYDGFLKFYSILPQYLNAGNSTKQSIGSELLIAILIGLVIAAISVSIMIAGMNTKKRQHGAAEYLKNGHFSLHTQNDLFLHSHVSKIPRPQNTSGSGSTTHRSSSGRTHGGHGGKF